jgi:hypothetical protein
MARSPPLVCSTTNVEHVVVEHLSIATAAIIPLWNRLDNRPVDNAA